MFAPKVAKPQTKITASSTNSVARQSSTLVAHRPSGHSTVEHAVFLQRTLGDQATLRLLPQRAPNLTEKEPGADHGQKTMQEDMTAREAPRDGSWDFSKIPLFPSDRASRPQPSSASTATELPGAIQAKLVVGRVNDPLEHEADRVADQVMRMRDPTLSIATAPPRISRKCAACEEEAQALQPKRARAPDIVREALRSPGQPLDAPTRAFFEPRFGHSFGGVRIHADTLARESARSVNALAYTLGRHLAFADGQYSPATDRGRRLLAHELVHVIQQAPEKGADGPARETVQRQSDGGASAAAPTVYGCVKSLESSPFGQHTFFRVGSEQSGASTYSLEPQDNRPLPGVDGANFHSGCWQGVPMRDVPEDKNSNDAGCIPTTMTLSCLDEQFSSYPIGKYCTLGPNSNSFVNFVARQCGMLALTFSGWTPGYDVRPPDPGTYAPSPLNTLLGCSEETGCLAVASSDLGGSGISPGATANDGQSSV